MRKRIKKFLKEENFLRAVVLLLACIAVLLALAIIFKQAEAKEPTQEPKATETATETHILAPTEAPTAEPTATPTPEPTAEPEEEPYLLDIPLSEDLQRYIYGLCQGYGVPYELAIAVIETESSFRPDAIRAGEDFGLMQINAFNHEWFGELFGVKDFLDPYSNTLCGVYYLGEQLEDSEGNTVLALMKYNMGPDEADAAWAEGTHGTAYSSKVLQAYERYIGG